MARKAAKKTAKNKKAVEKEIETIVIEEVNEKPEEINDVEVMNGDPSVVTPLDDVDPPYELDAEEPEAEEIELEEEPVIEESFPEPPEEEEMEEVIDEIADDITEETVEKPVETPKARNKKITNEATQFFGYLWNGQMIDF